MCIANCYAAFPDDKGVGGMKCVLLFLLVVMLTFTPMAQADITDSIRDSVEDGLGNMDFSNFDAVGQNDIGSVADKIRKIINGEFDDAADFLSYFLSIFFADITELIPRLISIFAVMVIVGLVRRSSGGFVSSDTEEVISFVGTAVVILMLLSLIKGVYVVVSDLLKKVEALSEAATPIALTLLIATGGNTLQSVCRPSMVMLSSLITAIQTGLLPLSLFSLIFAMVSKLSGSLRVEKLSSFLNNLGGWILGVVFMIFSAFTSVQGITAGALDGVSVRAAKFAAKSYIPFLGGYIADGFDMVLAGSTLIKNAFGLAVLAVLLISVIKPISYVLCVKLGLQAVAAISQPIVEDKLVALLTAVEKCLSFFVALIAAVSFMFAILMLITIGTVL